MSTRSGYTVALPSNSNMVKYPNNVGSLYNVVLASPLNLCGETLNDHTGWEVAMLSLHYSHTFINFLEDCRMYFVVDKPEFGDTIIDESPSHSVSLAGEVELNMDVLNIQDRLTYWVSERHAQASGRAGNELVGSFELCKKYYTNAMMLCNDIVDNFENIFFRRYQLKLLVKMQENGHITFTLSNGRKFAMYSDNPYLAKMLGLKSTIIYSPKGDARNPTRNLVVQSLATVGSETPQIKAIHALYVHANIVESQRVGDTMIPLVGYVDISGKPGDRISHSCNPPIYLPVVTPYIHTIEVRITDERGENILFPNTENVFMCLHFRKKV